MSVTPPSITSTDELFADGKMLFLAEMARAAYGSDLPAGLYATGIPYAATGAFVGGENGAAVALVGRSGDSLFVAFRGTDDDTDIDYWGRLPQYYEFYRPLINSLSSYISGDSSIRHVYVTGHSLGGAMAELFVANDAYWPNVDVEAVTFAPMGLYDGPDAPDDRITNVVIDQDFIRFSSEGGVVLGDEYIIDDQNAASNGGLYYHSVDNYVAVARYLSEAGIFPQGLYYRDGANDDIGIAANLTVLNGQVTVSDYHGAQPDFDAGVAHVFTTRQGGDSFYGTSPDDLLNLATDRFTDVSVDLQAGVAWSAAWPTNTTFANIVNVSTGSGDDTIGGDSGSNWLSGGAGLDTALYWQARWQAYVQDFGDRQTVTVGGVTDTLSEIERVEFSDGTLIFGLDHEYADFAYRLYAAAYGRTPDEAGLRFWTDVLEDRGPGGPDATDQEYVAGFFLTADEFVNLYGANPTDYQYVDAMYENVLGRLPDQAGYDFWVGAMHSGLGRGDILIDFAQSDENVAQTAPDLDNGIWVL
jgi:hypothetical protein